MSDQNDESLRRNSTLTENNLKSRLTRLYFSKHIQFFYLFLIGLCIFDLIWTLSSWKDYPSNKWALILDLILNIIVLLDSYLRLYTMGSVRFCDCRSNCIEILVFILAIPDVLILIILLSIDSLTSDVLQLLSLSYSTAVLVLRPIVFCQRQTRTKVPSIHLPNTVVYSETEANLIREQSRFDSIVEGYSYEAKKSLET
jgi:hypothetical protein